MLILDLFDLAEQKTSVANSSEPMMCTHGYTFIQKSFGGISKLNNIHQLKWSTFDASQEWWKNMFCEYNKSYNLTYIIIFANVTIQVENSRMVETGMDMSFNSRYIIIVDRYVAHQSIYSLSSTHSRRVQKCFLRILKAEEKLILFPMVSILMLNCAARRRLTSWEVSWIKFRVKTTGYRVLSCQITALRDSWEI